MSSFSGTKHKMDEEDPVGGYKIVRPKSDLKNLSDAQIKRVLLGILRRKIDHPEQYEHAQKLCEKAYISWNLDKTEPIPIRPTLITSKSGDAVPCHTVKK